MAYKIDVNSINESRVEMLNKINDIINNLDTVCIKIDESIEVFHTPTSAIIRDNANEYIYSKKKYINESVIPMIEKLQYAADTYEETSNSIKKSVS